MYVQNSNRNRGLVVYDIGQYVYIFERHLQPNTSKLLSKQWRGPYRIKRKVSDTLYVVSKFNPLTNKETEVLTHVIHMKPFIPRDDNEI